MNEFIVMQSNKICIKEGTVVVVSGEETSVVISASVGINGRNFFDDVIKIQRALNKVPQNQGGTLPPLVEDGVCGPKTNKAIQNFQLHHFGFSGADGRVDPNKQTIVKLNQVLFSNSPKLDPADDSRFLTALLANFALVQQGVRAANANILRAKIVVDAPDNLPSFGGTRAEKMARVNRHFKIDSFPNSQRSRELNRVGQVFEFMNRIVNFPLFFDGKGFFELDTSGDPRVAFTFPNGFFRTGEVSDNGTRKDTMHFGKRAINAVGIPDFVAFIMVHEMAHFIGLPGGIFIGDNGRGWFDDAIMQNLTLRQRLESADPYAGFAHECRTNDSSRPPWIVSSNASR
ncbi:MAG: peptidoglycan-binding protein [Acidobacteriota bacterium]